MKIQLSEIDRRLIKRVCNDILEETGIDQDNWIEVKDILAILDSLEDTYKDLEDKYNELQENIKDNYKPCSVNDNHRFYESTIEKLEKRDFNLWNYIKEKGLIEEYEKYNSEKN